MGIRTRIFVFLGPPYHGEKGRTGRPGNREKEIGFERQNRERTEREQSENRERTEGTVECEVFFCVTCTFGWFQSRVPSCLWPWKRVGCIGVA